jgi:hypothetical protein
MPHQRRGSTERTRPRYAGGVKVSEVLRIRLTTSKCRHNNPFHLTPGLAPFDRSVRGR